MKYLTLIIFIIMASPCNAQPVQIKDVIRDPVVSRRCKTLLKRRSEKIRVQQKLNALILRNNKAQEELKESQQVAKQKLTLNKTQLKNDLKLVKFRIKSMEENIVRQGCPGITL